MEEQQRKQISAYVRLSDSNVASGATPIGNAVAHPIEPTMQSFENSKTTLDHKGLEDSSRPQRTRRQIQLQRLKHSSHYKDLKINLSTKRFEVHWIEGSSDYSKAILITWRTNLVQAVNKAYSFHHPDRKSVV